MSVCRLVRGIEMSELFDLKLTHSSDSLRFDVYIPCVIDWDVFWFVVQVQKSPVFRRDGADIHSDLLVSVAQAVLGGTARAQGLYETLNLSVSRHIQASPILLNISNTCSVINDWLVRVFRSLQASRQTRGFVWQGRESLASVATAMETTTSTSK